MSAADREKLLDDVEANWPLLDQDRWWLWERRRRASGRPAKVPVRVGRGAALIPHAPGDPRAWRPWSAVRSDYLAGLADGVAFALGDGLVALDLDGCLDPDGVPDVLAAELLAALPGYAERSPSRTGLHFLAWAAPTLSAGNRRTGRVELLRTGLITVTGDAWSGHAGQPSCSTSLMRMWPQQLGLEGWTFPTPTLSPRPPPQIDALLRVATRLRNAERFLALWNGETHHHHSPSEADFALCRHLYFLLGPDATAIKHAFQGSGLYQQRPHNWLRRACTGPPPLTYAEITVQRAIACGGPTLPRPP